MSKGAVIFAYNSKLNYVDIATVAARLVKKYLDIPVTIITNDPDVDQTVFDKVIVKPLEGSTYERIFNFGTGALEKIEWHNQNRSSIYDLSPYDQTLLLDADYLIFNGELKKLFDTDLEFACYDRVHDLTGWDGLQLGAKVGTPGIPMQWATVVYFTRNQLAESVFSFMQLIKENYLYYAAAYNFDAYLFRNDYTLSIALQSLTGYNTKNFTAIPGSLVSLPTTVAIQQVRPTGELVFRWDYDNYRMANRIKDTSIHVMNKRSITDPNIIKQLTDFAQ